MQNPKTLRTARIILSAVVLAISIMAFIGIWEGAGGILQVQFAPAFLRFLETYSTGALIAVISIVVLTWLFGRFYCAVLCPFGILQDVLGWLGARLRYLVAGVVLGGLICGTAIGFYQLDPYSTFGRLAGAFGSASLVPAMLLIAVLAWTKRCFCNTVCPVGVILGWLAKWGAFRLAMGSACVKCGRCAKTCPAGCIDITLQHIDNERCLRCMNCIADCPKNAIGFVTFKKGPAIPPPAVSKSRRAMLFNGGLLLAGVALGVSLGKSLKVKAQTFAKRLHILPPGAGDAVRFAEKCTGCQLCVANCPAKILRTDPEGDKPVTINLANGSCQFDCHRCSSVCPTGAIRPLSLADKQSLKIAQTFWTAAKCVMVTGKADCHKCVDVCPNGAIARIKGQDGREFPRFEPSLCIGCGACQHVCPGEALKTLPIPRQIQAVKPEKRLVVAYRPEFCRVCQDGETCGLCGLTCPTGAITLKKRRSGLELPVVNADLCIACGQCQTVCPVKPDKAMVLELQPIEPPQEEE